MRHFNLTRSGSKSLILAAALALIICSTLGGTLAWMFDKSEQVVNTFVVGDIKLELTETDTQDDEKSNTNTYSLTLDTAIAKDPAVTVKSGSENAWVFVKIEESDNFDDFMKYQIVDDWKELDGEEGVYWCEVKTSEKDCVMAVLKDNLITVKEDVTQEMLDKLKADEYPTIKITAYAIQQEEIDSPAEAWKLLEKQM